MTSNQFENFVTTLLRFNQSIETTPPANRKDKYYLLEHWQRLLKQSIEKLPFPQGFLNDLFHRSGIQMQRSILANPNCPQHLLQPLLDSPSWTPFIAQNPNCPAQILSLLTTSENCLVRRIVAGNPSCPRSLLEQLAQDPDEIVARAVAGNPNCPAELISKLTQHPVVYVRAIATRNPNNPNPPPPQPAPEDNSSLIGRARPLLHPTIFNLINRSELHSLFAFLAPEIHHVEPNPFQKPNQHNKFIRYLLPIALVANVTTPLHILRHCCRYKRNNLIDLIIEHPNADEKLRAAIARKILMAA